MTKIDIQFNCNFGAGYGWDYADPDLSTEYFMDMVQATVKEKYPDYSVTVRIGDRNVDDEIIFYDDADGEQLINQDNEIRYILSIIYRIFNDEDWLVYR